MMGRMSETTLNDVLTQFSFAWPGDRIDYRGVKDDSWKAYGPALRDLVAAGQAGIARIEEGLSHRNRQVRALCARALGSLKTEPILIVPHEKVRTRAWQELGGEELIVLADCGFYVSVMYGVAFQMRIHSDTSNTPGTFLIDRNGILKEACIRVPMMAYRPGKRRR